MLYASGFSVSDREHITSYMQLYYDGSYYAIGGKRMNFQQEKTKQNFILTLPAIANAMKSACVSSDEVILGVGLPIDIYGAQKDAFGQYFLPDDIHFNFEEVNIIVESYAVRCLRKGMQHGASIIRNSQ